MTHLIAEAEPFTETEYPCRSHPGAGKRCRVYDRCVVLQ